MRGIRIFLFSLATMLLCVGQLKADVDIVFDYSYDTNNFFSSSQRRDVLEAAASVYEGVIKDSLDAVIDYYGDGGWNTWKLEFKNPSGGADISVDSDNIAYPIIEDRMVIFVGGKDFGASVSIGSGGPGGFRASGYTQAWFDLIGGRGEVGALGGDNATDFGPWGGMMSFDTMASWHFDHTVAPVGGTNDFYSVVLHELGHVFGLGSADSWDANLSGSMFTGSNAVSEYGSSVPLDGGLAHWLEDTMSELPDGSSQEVALDPSLTQGYRKELTLLDYAGLSDVGWEIELPVQAVCIDGDVNCDGKVSLLDLDILGAHYGDVGVGRAEGDLSGNGSVTLLDLDILGRHFGDVAMIPEPGGLLLLVVGGLFIRRV